MNEFWYEFLPKLWGALWIIIITSASFGVVLAIMIWIMNMVWGVM